ncbi:zinc transporter ZIP4 [Rhinichthys klamathensis goyatoka]|uniref:zinc transporter ZIP4 n=1 Tax=Rhinichthys klamathensis goyatoka TaxID=3034132 RepID=UPI0024B4DE49|nr:zinc transporter ZIP4 [Rhinichthys klamathensis goyatoka]
METRVILVLCFASLGVFSGARGDKKDIYAKVVDLLAPGEEFLTEDALVSAFERLENRVQCFGVSCGKPCVSLKDIVEESSSPHGDHVHVELDAVMGNVLYHALRGDCIKAHVFPERQFFLDYIFSRFGSGNLTLHDFEELLKTLNLGGEEHDHDHDHDHRRKTNKQSLAESHRTNSSWDTACFSAEDLWRIYGLNSSSLTRDQFTELSPALIQQILSQGCSEISPTPTSPDSLSTAERYGYATLANLIICLMAMCGIVVLLFSACTRVFELCIQFCISLAVGSLTGDALLHLLPAFLGLHVHGDGNDHDHTEENLDYVYKLLVLLTGVYFFYLMESIFSIITRSPHHHRHDEEESEVHHCDHGRVLQMFQQERQKDHSSSQADLVDAEKKEKSFLEPGASKREQRLLPYMITIGDGIHNFADGLALGAAFSISWRSGLATALAVLCHELPHELGDFAILLHCGVSVKRALLLNIGSSLTSFIGLYIALSVSTETAAIEWISAVTAGLFLYVGLADMLPSLVHVDSKRPWLVFLLQNLGLLSGWGILLLLSLYEDQIGL